MAKVNTCGNLFTPTHYLKPFHSKQVFDWKGSFNLVSAYVHLDFSNGGLKRHDQVVLCDFHPVMCVTALWILNTIKFSVYESGEFRRAPTSFLPPVMPGIYGGRVDVLYVQFWSLVRGFGEEQLQCQHLIQSNFNFKYELELKSHYTMSIRRPKVPEHY